MLFTHIGLANVIHFKIGSLKCVLKLATVYPLHAKTACKIPQLPQPQKLLNLEEDLHYCKKHRKIFFDILLSFTQCSILFPNFPGNRYCADGTAICDRTLFNRLFWNKQGYLFRASSFKAFC